ncbi:MAG: amidohydrolase [Dehalococcoidia bacterium]|nr:amidohydrolase [Dehalococcoidia bacterium]
MPGDSRLRLLTIYGGRVVTMHPAHTRADAILLAGGRVHTVGSTADVRAAARSLGTGHGEELHVPGACVLPGLTDAHVHLGAYGLQLQQLDLSGARSLDEVVALVAARAALVPSDEWLLGGGWDHTLWPEPRLPNRHALDAVLPNQPVALGRKDRHITWVNTAALLRAGIDWSTPQPAGGVIDREPDGQPSGLVRETAQRLVEEAIGDPPADVLEGALTRAQTALLQLGLTCVHAPDTPATYAALQDIHDAGELQLRVIFMPPASALEDLAARRMSAGWGSERLRLGHLKCFLDGSLGSHTASMLSPFEDEPDSTGIVITHPEALVPLLGRAAEAGFGLAMHAIGDRANRQALDAVAAANMQAVNRLLRPRIEHVQLLHQDDIPRLAELGVIASMQPIHTTQDMANADRYWGARSSGAYAFASLLRAGTVLAFGSDAPVEAPDPLAGLFAAVTRQRPSGMPVGGWYPQERISLAAAVRAYTAGAAAAAGLEHERGSLRPGAVADVTIIQPDIFGAPPEAMLEARVSHTIIAGEVVYAADWAHR